MSYDDWKTEGPENHWVHERSNPDDDRQRAELLIERLDQALRDVVKAWDDWYDGPETPVPGDLVEAVTRAKRVL